MNKPLIDILAERFCATPIPESVCADLCATRQGPGRTGTNLLSVIEAKEVLAKLLADCTVTIKPTDDEIRLLSIELEKNLNEEFWMGWFVKWSEHDFIEATMRVSCHPEGWDYACLCGECQSNA